MTTFDTGEYEVGIFDRFFSGRSGADAAVPVAADEQLTCDSCGQDVDEYEMEEGQCLDCRSSEYTGAKYCCGAIYEDGEDTCMSCGEPL